MNVKKQNKITVPVAGSMNSNGTEQCRAFKQPLAELFTKNGISTKSGKRVLGLGRCGQNS